MILSDGTLRERIESGEIGIEPFEPDNIEPSSIDLRLGDEFKLVLYGERSTPLDISSENNGLSYQDVRDFVIIEPGDFVLAQTKEHIEVPDDLVASVLGRSSLGRLGISVHQTAGYIDPGFRGQITLELSNHGPAPIKLESDLRICQIIFEHLDEVAESPYGHEGSQYQNQSGVTPSRHDFD